MVRIFGALVGWKREPTESGIVLTLRVASSVQDYADGQLDRVSLALNDRQLRSLCRDLMRAAGERNLSLFATRRSRLLEALGLRRS